MTNQTFRLTDGSGLHFEYADGAPDEWSKALGATHTLYLNSEALGSDKRAAIIKKTVAFVAVDEDDCGRVVWEKWQIALVA